LWSVVVIRGALASNPSGGRSNGWGMNISILNRPIRRAEERPLGASFVTTGEATDIGLQVRQRLWQQMARECEAMVELALGTARTVPVEIVERLDQALCGLDVPAAAAAPGQRGVDDFPRGDATLGSALPATMSRLASLSVAHGALAHIIAPATPEAVLLLADERATHPLWYALGPLPIVRQMLILAILSLLLLLGVALSEEVNVVNMGKTMLELAGYQLFVKEIYLLSAASLGSCFQNLQKINVVISDGTYDPKSQSTYWTRWVMGVISGVILSQLIYNGLLHAGISNASAGPPTIGQPILALLGGYSGDVVHGILSHTVNTVGSFFRVTGDPAIDSEARARVTNPGTAASPGAGARPGAGANPGSEARPDVGNGSPRGHSG
jgi:hypothetical protein